MGFKKYKYIGVVSRPPFTSFYPKIGKDMLPRCDTPEAARDVYQAIKAGRVEQKQQEAIDAPEGTVTAAYRRYLKIHLSTLKPATQLHARSDFRLYIEPRIGKKKLAAITKMDIRELQIDVGEAVSACCANTAVSRIRAFYNWLIAYDIVFKNPAIGLPKLTQKEREPLFMTDDQITAFMNTLEGQNKVICALGVMAGARRSEMLGFEWRDFDFEKETISFNRELLTKGLGHISTLKTDHSYATLPMNQPLKRILLSWKAQTSEGQEYLFTNVKNKRRLQNASYYSIFWVNRIRPKIPEDLRVAGFRFHDLRHSFASYLIHLGMKLIDVSKFMRHANTGITEKVYGHLYPNRLFDELEKAKFDL